MTKIKTYWSVYDQYGRLEKRILAKSYVRAWIDLHYAQMSGALYSAPGMPDITNTNRRVDDNTSNFNTNAGAGEVVRGIVVGTGLNAVAMTDYALQTQILHGVGAGQLQHGAMAHTECVTVGASRWLTAARTFTNGSGGNITVNEVGLYIIGYQSVAPAGNYYFCGERTLLTFTINNGTNKTVTYSVGITL